jgi:anti-sigma factor (TIGR02949 family)
MKCNDAAALIAAYADGETNGSRGRKIRDHLAGCPQCAAMHEELLALRAHIKSEVPRYPAPQALRARVLASLDVARQAERARSSTWLDRWRWLAGGALAGCTATVLAWFVGTAIIDWRVNEDVAVEAVTSHVRATLGNQLIQVASSNQHTVKPWLSSRLDYSPPVPDMQAQGFTLIGGRVDYLDQRPCATLVYKIRDHNVDVFVRPATARMPPIAMRTVRGINVAHATGSGMDWLAVSDVSAEVLTAFVQDLARGNGTQ